VDGMTRPKDSSEKSPLESKRCRRMPTQFFKSNVPTKGRPGTGRTLELVAHGSAKYLLLCAWENTLVLEETRTEELVPE
jgi:hypothetical protein